MCFANQFSDLEFDGLGLLLLLLMHQCFTRLEYIVFVISQRSEMMWNDDLVQCILRQTWHGKCVTIDLCATHPDRPCLSCLLAQCPLRCNQDGCYHLEFQCCFRVCLVHSYVWLFWGIGLCDSLGSHGLCRLCVVSVACILCCWVVRTRVCNVTTSDY